MSLKERAFDIAVKIAMAVDNDVLAEKSSTRSTHDIWANQAARLRHEARREHQDLARQYGADAAYAAIIANLQLSNQYRARHGFREVKSWSKNPPRRSGVKRAPKRAPRKRPASIFDQTVQGRMQEIAEIWSSMPRTGRARFADDQGRPTNFGYGDVVGVNKGYAKAFPEVAGLAAPGRIIEAIRKGKGRLFEDVKLSVQDWAARQIPHQAPLSRGRKAGPHSSIRRCKICRTVHTGTAHRSHGPGAFGRRMLPVSSLGDLRPAMTKQRRAELLDALEFQRRRQARRLGPSVQAEEVPDWVTNPPVEIYPATRGVTVFGMKKGPGHPCDASCKRAGHHYRHHFPESVRILGSRDGSVILKKSRA